MTTLRDRYLACWNAEDDVRTALVADLFAPDARYVDPLAEVSGVEAIDAAIGGVRAQFPGLVFTAVGDPDSHHDVVRFRWGLGPDGDEPMIIGADAVVVDADGRIATVLGFLDRAPA